MSYKSNTDLPSAVKDNIPKHAQDIWRKAFNSAKEQYSDEDDTEERAAKVAWAAVKKDYEKGDDGKWHKK